MKKITTLIFFVSLFAVSIAQEERDNRIPLLGESAPSFTAETTNGTLNFPGDFGNKWKVLLSHPQDFTPVCSSEILELAQLQSEFDRLGAKVVVVSTDNLKSHKDWVSSLEEIKYKDRAPVKIKFPLVDDFNKTVAKKYGMIHPNSNSSKDVRGVFIIDPNNKIQAVYFYPMSVGRSTSELLRALTALQTASGKDHIATPADWKHGDDVLVTVPPKGAEDNTKPAPDGFYRVSWYMLFKEGSAQ